MWNNNFATFNETRSESGLTRKGMRLEEVFDYLKCMHDCELSKSFKKRMKVELQAGYFRPTREVVDALVKEWHIWKEYVTPDSYSSFIQDGLESMFKIMATATFHSPNLNSYIGNKATVIKKLPNVLATSVTKNGRLCINGKRVRV